VPLTVCSVCVCVLCESYVCMRVPYVAQIPLTHAHHAYKHMTHTTHTLVHCTPYVVQTPLTHTHHAYKHMTHTTHTLIQCTPYAVQTPLTHAVRCAVYECVRCVCNMFVCVLFVISVSFTFSFSLLISFSHGVCSVCNTFACVSRACVRCRCVCDWRMHVSLWVYV